MHSLGGQQDDELRPQLPLRAHRAQLQLAAAPDHVLEHRIEREPVLAGPFRDRLADAGAVATQEGGGRRRAAVLGIVAEDAQEVAVVARGMPDGIVRALLVVVLGQSLGELAQGVDEKPTGHERLRAGDLRHQFVDIFELLEGRPPGIALAPIRAGGEPDREGLGEILVRVALGIPERQVLDVTPARRVRAVVVGVAGRGAAEQLLPAAAALQLEGYLQRMSGLMAQDPHAFRDRAPLHVDEHLALEPHQAGVRQVEGNRDARTVVRAEPLVRDPGVGLDPELALLQLVVQALQAPLEPGPFDRDPEVFEPQLQQLLVRQGGPRKSASKSASGPVWHWRCVAENESARRHLGIASAILMHE